MSDLVAAPEGAALARRFAADYLRTYLPDYLADMRRLWKVSEDDLPDPRLVLPHPALAADRYPLIAVSSVRDSAPRRTDHSGVSIEYRTTYSLRVFSFVNTRHQAPVYDMRDRYAAAIRVAFLDSPTLRGKPAVVEEDTLSVSHGDPRKAEGDRFVAGSFVAVGLRLTETLVRAPGATVGAVKVDGHLLPVSLHPALE